jgi:glycine/D-amino acid oxidase-like deaminating enzyme
MNTTKKQSVAVIGAGIIGINCALELQSQGFQVTLLDKNAVGGGCSKGNAGHFATEQVFPLAEVSLLWQLPKLLLDRLGPVVISPRYFTRALPWFMRFIKNMTATNRYKNTQALKRLNQYALEQYKVLLKETHGQHLLTLNGSLLVFETSSLKQVEKQFNHYRQAGVAVKLLDRQQTLSLEPNLADSIQYALYFTEVGHSLDPFALCTYLAALSLRKGATYQKFAVKRIDMLDQQVCLSDGETRLKFDQVVIATGAWSKNLLAQLGYKLPIEAERGYSLTLNKSTQGLLSRPVASAERRFIMTPMAQGLRLAGTVEFAGLEQKANMKRADILYQGAKKVLADISDLEPAERWMGCRPSLPDSLPVIGQAPQHKQIYLALGHQHLGLTHGAITGKLIGQLMTQQKTTIDLSPFCLSRFN